MQARLRVALGLAVMLVGGLLIGRGLTNPAASPLPAMPPLAAPAGPGATPRPDPTAVGSCPRSAAEISAVSSSAATSWRRLTGNEHHAWKYGPAPGAPITDGAVTVGWKADWWDNARAHNATGPARIPFATEATIWCQP